jgi:CheY-like chemotaxis protein
VSVTTGAERVGAERLRVALLGEGHAGGTYVVLEVADTGCGMDAATQRRIFEPFFSTKFAGRGLGLSAVLGVVRQLRGALELESAPGHGTRFRVLFPAEEGAAVTAGAERAADDWTGEGLVLVVDDDAAIRRALRRLVGKLGFDVLEAPDGAKGIELYRREAGRIRAVILDLTMPQLDGVETLRALRRVDAEAYVVISSGWGEAEVEARCRGERPDGFMQKPFGLEGLRLHLRAALERSRRRTAE